jgi:hypothetical protein
VIFFDKSYQRFNHFEEIFDESFIKIDEIKILVGMVWVGVGFRFENPHQAGLGFSGEDWVGVGFTVGF